MLMLMAVRHAKSVICRADAHDYRLHDVRGRELRDLTVGVVGTGRIGTAVVDRLRGFGCRVLTHDSRPQDRDRSTSPSTSCCSSSDIVTLHTPLTADTHHLLDRRRIEQLKPGAVVVNTGRGALLDTEALVSALESGAPGRCGAGRPRRGGRGLLRRPPERPGRRARCCCGSRRCRTCSSARTRPSPPTTP